MSTRFLNIFFRYSGFVFNTKQKIATAQNWYKVLPHAVLLLFIEMGFAVVSLPFYFLVSPKKLQESGIFFPSQEKDISKMHHYIVRRRISLATFFGVGSVFVIKVFLIGVVFSYLMGVQTIFATTLTWTFSSPSDYTFDSTKIEFSGDSARLKDLGSITSSSTINSGLTSDSTGWTYADWTDPSNVVVGGTRQTTGGNPGPYPDVNIAINGSGSQNRTGAGYWQQTFITNVSSPDSATLNLDWKSITYTSPVASPNTYKLYAFIETASGAPVSTSTAVWNSGEITGVTSWAGIATTSITSKIPTAGTYYLKIAAYATSPLQNQNYSFVSGFDNIIANWSKVTSLFSTSTPTTTPVNSLSATRIVSWNTFTESANPNGGSINYQLSGDNGANWKYWNGSSWATTTLSTNVNSSSTINFNIASFATSTNQIKWRAFFTSNGSQQVTLNSVAIDYTENLRPSIASLTSAQQTSNGNVALNYNLVDTESDPSSLSSYQFSTNTTNWFTMTASTTDPAHNGVSGLSASPAGTAHTFVWSALADLGRIYNTSVYARLRANDGIADGVYTTSSVFTVDYVVPAVTNV